MDFETSSGARRRSPVDSGYLDPTGQMPWSGGNPTPYGVDASGRARPRTATTGPGGGGPVRGVARGVQARSEMIGNGQSRQILAFRLERYDGVGNRQAPISVEMRAYSLTGQIADGDEVQVHGQWRRGVLRVRQIENLSTGGRVREPSGMRTLRWIAGVLVAVFLLFIISFLAAGWFGIDLPWIEQILDQPVP